MPYRSFLQALPQTQSERHPPLWIWTVFAGWLLVLAVLLVRLIPGNTFSWICRG